MSSNVSSKNENFQDKLNEILKRCEEVEGILALGGLSSTDLRAYSKEYSEILPVTEKIRELFKLQINKAHLEKDLAIYSINSSANLAINSYEREMHDMIKDEIFELKSKIECTENAIKILLIPVDEDDVKNAIVEIRAGTGGEEASLFANNLFEMYTGYAVTMGWKYEILSFSQTDLGGLKEVIFLIQGKSVFGKLKFESGVHRVQRVPITETSGRIHTSTATVAVLSETQDIDIKIRDEDIRIDVFRSSGPGGQSVNTTDSAVRITHIPTGLVVTQQDEKSQHKNKAKALRILQARLHDLEKQKRDNERSENRRSQIGSGDRSERIRTYNYHDNRVTDHRINLTLYKLDQILSGNSLNEVIDALLAEDRASKLIS